MANRYRQSVASIPGALSPDRLTQRYSSGRLRTVDRPTTRVLGEISPVDAREGGFNRAGRGDFGRVVQREYDRLVTKYPLSAALAAMQDHLANVVDGPVAPEPAPIPLEPEVLSRHVKKVARFLRADAVGVCELPPYAVYSHNKMGERVVNNHKFAVGILVDQNYESFAGGNGNDWISNSQSFVSYSASGFIACILADYIRRLGYPARAHHARDYQVVVPPILLQAGLGEMCRIGGIVLNPFLGPRFKAAVVTTDLPLAPDHPIDFGAQSFCAACKKCARECPSKAITSGGKSVHNGYETWMADFEACTRYRITNARGAGCGRCIKVCPWNKAESWHHRLASQLASRSVRAQKGLVWLDDALGYGKGDPDRKWWFDLEEVDSRLVARG